jgi:hypothetical protein
MKIIYFILVIALPSIFSCSNDLNFTLPKIDPLLSVQSFVDPDNFFQVTVSIAKPLQYPYIEMGPDCLVDIYENNLHLKRLLLDTMSYRNIHSDKRFLRFLSDTEMSFSEGNEYRVEVIYPGFEPVTAKAIKPELVKIKQLTWRKFTGEMPDWYYKTPWKLYHDDHSTAMKRDTNLLEFAIVFDDPPGTSNYYRVGVNLITKFGFNEYLDRRLQYASNELPDPCFMRFDYKTWHPLNSGWVNPMTFEILWNDNNFNGEEHTIKILVPGSQNIPAGTKFIISLYSLSMDYYKYMADKWEYSKAADDPFAEPIRLFSNVSNGCGIFAFSSVDADSVVFSQSK